MIRFLGPFISMSLTQEQKKKGQLIPFMTQEMDNSKLTGRERQM